MYSPPKTLWEKDLNLLRNDRIKFEICPLVYQIIIEWGFEKPDHVTIKQHMENQKIEEKSGVKLGKLFKKNEDKFNKKDFSSFDVTFLHEILPFLCYDKVTQTGVKEWVDKLKDTNSIEYLLKEIKSYRNEVSHDFGKAKGNPKIEAKKVMMMKCIRTAGTLYGKDQSEIDGKIAHLEAKFSKLLDETCTYESAVKHVTELIEKESAPFMLEKYSESFSVPLPGGLGKVDTAQIFESVNLSVADEENSYKCKKIATVRDKYDAKKKKIVFSSNEIFNHVTHKFVVINGGPGSGKTTLLRNIYQNILDNSVNRSELSYKDIGRFKVPIYLECRTERQNNLRDFLKQSTPNFCSHKDVIYDAFKEMKRRVFLIDGYDEVNDDSRKLVDEIVLFCSNYGATCIISGRVDAGNNFIRDLQDRNLSFDELLIEPISEMSDKLSFLKRYGDKMVGDVDSEELVKSFENLNDSAQKVFFSPVLLAMFISLFLNNRNCLSQLHNEQSTYKAIREIFSEDIQKKLRDSNIPNPKGRTKDILVVISYYSLLLFKSREYFFKEDEYESLVEDCEQKLSKDIDIEKLLTCILTPEASLKQDKSFTYSFIHSTIQEYLAVEQINKNMRESNIDWNSEQLSRDSLRESFLECLGVSSSHSDVSTKYSDVEKEVRRYGNIIKLLILETMTIGHLRKFTKTFTAVLRGCFGYNENYLFDLVYSSNCDSAIVSIVSDVLRERRYYYLRYTRHIRTFTEVLKKRLIGVSIEFIFSESLTDTDCLNLGQLVSLLNDYSEISLHFHHSYNNYQPLNGEFYIQLNNSKCKVTAFRACVTSSEHLSTVMRLLKDGRYDLFISTVSACDVSFATLKEHRGTLTLRAKYTNDLPNTGSNPVTERTYLTITDVPADNIDNFYNIIKFLCPKSKKFESIELDNCHLADIDINELLKKFEGEKIRTERGQRAEVMEIWVNEDKSKNLELHLPDIEKREAERREAEQEKAAKQRAALIEIAKEEEDENEDGRY